MPACRRIFGFFASRCTAWVLLPLYLTASLLGGGWFCADGTQCRPSAAATCCCEDHAPAAVDDCCLHESGHPAVTVADAACGCYYQADSIVALLTSGAFLDHAAALPASPGVQVSEPLSRTARHLAPAATISPPRYLRFPADGRAPPRV